MSKNKKSSKKQLIKFMQKNRVILAGLAGAATGIAVAGLLGTEKAKQLVHTIDDAVTEFENSFKSAPEKNMYRGKQRADVAQQPAG